MPVVTEEHRNQRRDQILDAACRCFSQHGFHAASMKQVCTEAGLSPGAVYNYFGSKDEIISELVTRGRDERKRVLTGGTGPGLENLLAQFSNEGMDAARLDLSIWAAALNDPVLAGLVQEVFLELVSSLEPDSKEKGVVLLSLVIGLEVQLALDPDFDVSAYLETTKSMLKTKD